MTVNSGDSLPRLSAFFRSKVKLTNKNEIKKFVKNLQLIEFIHRISFDIVGNVDITMLNKIENSSF